MIEGFTVSLKPGLTHETILNLLNGSQNPFQAVAQQSEVAPMQPLNAIIKLFCSSSTLKVHFVSFHQLLVVLQDEILTALQNK